MSGLGNGGEVKETHKTCVVGTMQKNTNFLLFPQNFDKKLILAKMGSGKENDKGKFLRRKISYCLKWDS